MANDTQHLLALRARRWQARGPHGFAGKGGEAKHLGAALREQDPAARQILNETAEDLAFGLSHEHSYTFLGKTFSIGAHDLYPDVVACLAALKAEGYFIGIAGNQPASAEATLRACGLAADFVATSDGWGVAKPDPEFFAKVREAVGCDASQIAYVGDRVDNDVLPSLAAGMRPILLRRGPWGRAQWAWPEAANAHLKIETLAELPGRLAELARS